MNKKDIVEIKELSSLIFEDKKYKQIETFLREKEFNKLRIFIADELEILEIDKIFATDVEKTRNEIEICSRIENVVINHCIEITQ